MPFTVNATIARYFFDSSDSIEIKSQALVSYDNKFVPSLGVVYTYDNAKFDVVSSFSGTVVEINEELEDAPELLNQDAFANWIMKVEMSDPSELEGLMDAAAYEAMCANE